MDATTVGWYPNPPVGAADEDSLSSTTEASAVPRAPPPPPVPHVPHAVWGLAKAQGGKKYLAANNWGKVSREQREAVRRGHIHGVEVRDLPEGHLLHGEQVWGVGAWLGAGVTSM